MISTTELLNELAAVWSNWMLGSIAETGFIFLLLSLIWRGIGQRVSPQLGYLLFLLILLKPFVPFSIPVPQAFSPYVPQLVWANQDARLPTQRMEPVVAAAVMQEVPASMRVSPSSKGQASTLTKAGESELGESSALVNFEPSSTQGRGGFESEISSSSNTGIRSVPARFSFAGIAMIAWLVGLLVMVALWAYSQLRFRRVLDAAKSLLSQPSNPLSDDCGVLAGVVENLTNRGDLPEGLVVKIANDLSSPCVLGLLRPTILIPKEICLQCEPAQLEWILLHEYAHVQRRDLLVMAFQRIVTLLQYTNPFVWLANRKLGEFREFACDDLAQTKSRLSCDIAGEAFLQVLQHAAGHKSGFRAALGVGGYNFKVVCKKRLVRLLDSERPLSTQLGVRSSLLVALLALVLLPHLRFGSAQSIVIGQEGAAAVAPGVRNELEPKSNDEPKEPERRFELTIVGPDLQPISQADVDVRGRPTLEESWIDHGLFKRKGNYGSLVRTDEQGRLSIRIPNDVSYQFTIKGEGYAPYSAQWEHEPMPEKFQAVLDRGVRIGGVIVDEAGIPIVGAEIRPYIYAKKRPGDASLLGTGAKATTDQDGRWSYAYVSDQLQSMTVEITHPEFKPARPAVSLDTFVLRGNMEPTAKLTMDKGFSVTGTIVDEQGRPIAGALVRTKVANDVRRAVADDEGEYILTGCDENVAKIVVSAAGMAVDMQDVQIAEDMEPVNFVMKPGGHVRIRVVDEHNQPIPKAVIFFQRWRKSPFRYFEFDDVNKYTDENGIWEWNEAPLDEFQADICRPDGMQLVRQPLIARAEEYVFSPPPALVIVGKVIDAETQQPIERFQVVPGVRADPQNMNWVPNEMLEARDGHFEYRNDRGYLAHLLKVQARGYLPIESRDIKSDEGRVEITFELKRGADIDMRVMTPEGTPAEGANVALGIPGAQINVKNGEIDDGSTYAQREVVNAAGRFRFPAQATPYQLIITHEAGYAHINSETAERLDLVRLTAWAKAKGVYRVAGKPVSGVELYLNSGNVHSYGDDVPSISTSSKAVTERDGSYHFDRVLPGDGGLQRSILKVVGEGAKEVTSATLLRAEFAAGETKIIDFGGDGAPVVGRLLPAKGFTDRVLWTFADVDVVPQIGPGPLPVPAELTDQPTKQNDWFEAWRKTEDGMAWMKASQAAEDEKRKAPRYSATVDRDGSFKIDDMPAGDYLLSVRFYETPPAGSIRNWKFSLDAESAKNREQVDLGIIQLE